MNPILILVFLQNQRGSRGKMNLLRNIWRAVPFPSN